MASAVCVMRMAAFFNFKGLKTRVFFDWDVRGRAASGRDDPFYFGSVSNIEMEVRMTVEEMKAGCPFCDYRMEDTPFVNSCPERRIRSSRDSFLLSAIHWRYRFTLLTPR